MVSYLKFAIVLNAVDNFSYTFRRAAKEATTLGGKLRAVGSAIRAMAAEMAALAFVSIVDLIGQAAQAAAQLDRLAREATIFASDVSDSIEDMNAIFRQFNAIMMDANRLQMFTPEQIGDLLKFMALAGATSKEIDDTVDTIGHLAYSTGTELADAGRIALNVMRAFGIESTEVGAIADGLTIAVTNSMQSLTDLGQTLKYAAPSMAAAGRSMAETVTAAGLLADAGLRATQAGTALRQTVAQLLKPTDESIRLQSKYNLELVEMTDAGEKAKESLARMAKETERFQDVVDRTQWEVKSLQYAMEELAIGTTENQLQIMSIRLRAQREGRDLTQDELDRIDKLRLANDILAYEEQQLSLETMKMGHEAAGAQLGMDKLAKSQEDAAEAARTGIKGIRPIEDILRELEKVGEDTAVIFELFGIRSATAVLALRNAMKDGMEGADLFAAQHEKVASAIASDISETGEKYGYAASGMGAELDKLAQKQATYRAQLGQVMLPLYIKVVEAMTALSHWFSDHSKEIGALVGVLMKLAEGLGKVLSFLLKYPEILGIMVGYWLAMKIAIPIRALIDFVKWLRLAFAVMKTEGFEMVIFKNRLKAVAAAALGVGFAIGGAISAYRMLTAESPKARAEAFAMTAAQWALAAAFFAVYVAEKTALTLGAAAPLAIGIALAAAAAMYGIAEYGARMQKGGIVGGSLKGTPILAGEKFTTEAVVPLEHGAIPVEITGGTGEGGTNISIDRIEVNVVDGDQVVDQVTEAVYDGVRRGIAGGA